MRCVLSNPPRLLSVSLQFPFQLTSLALEQSRQVLDGLSIRQMEETQQRHPKPGHIICMHRWPFLKACGPQCNQEIVRVMKTLQPLLQETIQKKCQTRLWEAPSAVKGPLTWRQFNRMAGRGKSYLFALETFLWYLSILWIWAARRIIYCRCLVFVVSQPVFLKLFTICWSLKKLKTYSNNWNYGQSTFLQCVFWDGC